MQSIYMQSGTRTWGFALKFRKLLFALSVLVLWGALASNRTFAFERIEAAPAAAVLQYKGESLRKGVGLRTRLWKNINEKSLALLTHVDWEYHPFAPTFTFALGKHWGDNVFFELAAGLWFGNLLSLGTMVTVIPAFGFKMTQKLSITIPFIFRTDLGWFRPQFLPYIGFRF